LPFALAVAVADTFRMGGDHESYNLVRPYKASKSGPQSDQKVVQKMTPKMTKNDPKK